MRVHDATSIEATENTNEENRKNSKFLRTCSLFYTILGIGIIRWGDRCFKKITIALRLIQIYYFYRIALTIFVTQKKFMDSLNLSRIAYIGHLMHGINTSALCLLLLQGFFKKNNIERQADDIEKIDKKFPELSLTHKSKVHYYAHTLGLVGIGLIFIAVEILNFVHGERKGMGLYFLWPNSLILISLVLFYNCVYDVHQRFKRINELCTDMGNQEAVPLEKIRFIRKLKILHIELSKRVLEIVRAHRITAVIVIIRFFIIFTLNLMVYIDAGPMMHKAEIDLVVNAVESIGFLLLCVECTNATTEANSTTHYIYGMVLKDPAMGLRMEVLNFVSYLRVQRVEFNPYGLARMNNRLMAFILMALIAHMIFFIDIKKS